MKVQTVNVIEVIDMSVAQVFSFYDHTKGNKEAEAAFVKLAEKNGMSEDETEEALESRYWNDGGESRVSIFLTHSS